LGQYPFIFLVSFTTQAQVRLGVALEPAVPVGTLSAAYSFGVGAGIGVHYQVADAFALGLKTSYIQLIRKNGLNEVRASFLPIQLDGRVYFGGGDLDNGGVYLNGLLGVHVYNVKILNFNSSSTEFSLAPGIGYQTADGLNLSMKYQFIIVSGATSLAYLGLGIGYDF